MKFVIKLFPEIIVKSRPVRKNFIKQLKVNIKRILKGVDDGFKVRGDWDRVDVIPSCNHPDLIQAMQEKLQHTPGIEWVLLCDDYHFNDRAHLRDIVMQQLQDDFNHHSFCVRVKRTGQHDFRSIDLERELGSEILKAFPSSQVKLKKPDIELAIEVVKDRLFMVRSKHRGIGGYPLGMQDACLSLISGGFDSTVSSYQMMRRGVRTHFCFFNLGGSAHEVGVKQVAHYLWSKYGASHRVLFTTVPFEGVVEELLTKVDNAYMGVLLKRMMLRAASAIAEHKTLPALVTGEAIAQVSSQTMKNLNAIDGAVEDLVLRPLISMHKQEIIEIAQQIGTAEFAANMPEYCGVISDKPTIAAKKERVAIEEERFDFAVLEQAIANQVTIPIDKVLEGEKSYTEVDIVSAPALEDVILDIRHPQEHENKPLFLTNNEILHIPFYKLEREFKQLDTDKSYLLYCDKGVMSELQAQHLIQNGFDNVKVYR
ncbi:MAG: tRNA uracil 4-sulfurtransferase ThiI [Pseudomonadota bacterium]